VVLVHECTGYGSSAFEAEQEARLGVDAGLEIESIRVGLQLTWLGQRLKRLMDQESDDAITDEQFHDALGEIRDELPH